MAILFKKVKQKINNQGQVDEKFLAKINIQQTVGIEQLCRNISESTTFTPGEIMGIIWELEHQISNEIENSNAVKLGYLGTFYPCISSSAVDSFDQCDYKTVKKKYCRFKPSKSFTAKIKNTALKSFESDSYFVGKRKDLPKDTETEENLTANP